MKKDSFSYNEYDNIRRFNCGSLLKRIALLSIIGLFFLETKGQIVVIQPGLADGIDVAIDTTRTLNPHTWYTPHGSDPHAGFGVYWCYPDGFNVICWARFLIDFNLETLQSDTTFASTKIILSTYSIQPNSFTRSATFSISRIISDWGEDTVLWATQPSIDTTERIFFSVTDSTKDSIEVDVSPLVKRMMSLPDSSFGLMIDFTTWNMPGSVAIYTSEHIDSTKHPKLVVEYPSVGIIEDIYRTNVSLKVQPNPANDKAHVSFNASAIPSEIVVNDLQGIVVKRQNVDLQNPPYELDIEDLLNGLYFLQITKQGKILGTTRFNVLR